VQRSQAKTTYEEIVEFAEKAGIIKSIIIAGPRTDIPHILSFIDISVIPSLSEGFSNTILESMAAGKPMVATNVGGNPETVVDAKTGFLVPPADPESMAHALRKLLSDPQLRHEMGFHGRERVEKEFTLVNMLNRYEDILEHVYKRNRGSMSTHRVARPDLRC
jgi:glycosyltransferase involved in cell wall biosynthesis